LAVDCCLYRWRGLLLVALLIVGLEGAAVGEGASSRWIWHHPQPQGNDLLSLWGEGQASVWACGKFGALQYYDGAVWTYLPQSDTTHLNAIRGDGGGGLWVVGDEGLVRHLSPRGVSEMRLPGGAHLFDVCPVREGPVFVVGAGGTILTVTPQDARLEHLAEGADLYAVTATSGNFVWAAGSRGTLLFSNGREWFPVDLGTTATFTALSGVSPFEIWLVGEEGTCYFFNGRHWLERRLPRPVLPTAVQAFSGGTAAVLSADGSVFFWNGVQWQEEQVSRGGEQLYALWGDRPDGLWVAGGLGVLHYRNAYGWQEVMGRSAETFQAVWGKNNTDIWCVGDMGGILRGHAGRWTRERLPDGEPLNAVWGSTTDAIWAAGKGGRMLYSDGRAWYSVPSGTTDWLRDIFGFAADAVYACGQESVLRFDGRTWSTIYKRPGMDFLSLWGPREDRLYALGVEEGSLRLLFFDGSRWYPVRSFGPAQRGDLWGRGENDLWVAAQRGALFHWDGAAWDEIQTPDFSPEALGGLPGQELWVLTAEGFVWRRQGTGWAQVTERRSSRLKAICSAEPGTLWAVGTGETVLHYGAQSPVKPVSPTVLLAGYVPLRGDGGGSAQLILALGRANAPRYLEHLNMSYRGQPTGLALQLQYLFSGLTLGAWLLPIAEGSPATRSLLTMNPVDDIGRPGPTWPYLTVR
jgi:hypothetical protein